MKHFGQTLCLKSDPATIARYVEYHQRVWPEVLAGLREAGVHEMRIYLLGNRLFMDVETADDFEPAVDFPRSQAHPRAAEWNRVMGELQESAPEAKPGEWWAMMTEVFALNWPRHLPVAGDAAVDSHQHYWQLSRFSYDWISPDDQVLNRDYLPSDLRPILDRVGVRRTVAVQAHQSVAETRWLLALSEEHSWIAGVVGWVDLTAPDVGAVLDDLCRHPKLKGIRHIVQDEADPRWLLRPEVLRGLGEVARHGLAYDLLLRPRHIACVRPIYDRWPELQMVVDHIAKPMIADRVFEPWAREMTEIARIPGLHCKVSGMVTEADKAAWKPADLLPYVGHVVECFGEDRLMFGSDWPVCQQATSYERVVGALDECLRSVGMSEAGRIKVFGPNAARFYHLG